MVSGVISETGVNKQFVEGVQASESDMDNADASSAAFTDSWRMICGGLRRDLGAHIYGQWIKPIRLGRFDAVSGELVMQLPTDFAANWVRDHYADRLRLAMRALHSEIRSIRIVAKEAMRTETLRRAEPVATRPGNAFGPAPTNGHAGAGFETGSTPLDPRMTFANFVRGSSNILAVSAAERMAAVETPLFSPLYFQAATGQGKTHLMHAIGHAYRAQNPGARVLYMSAERFMVDFVQSMRGKQMMEFKTRLRDADMLLIDDIQFIVGKASTQEEFLHTIDALSSTGKRLIVAADRAPQALDGVDQRILSRLSQGLVADMQAADLELRRSILTQRLAQMPQAEVSEDVVEFLARTISRNVRELEGGLNKLLAYAQLTGKPVSRQLAEEQLSDILSACRRRITIDEIQRAVCEYYRIDRSEMSSKRRARAVVRPRQVAMYLAKVMTPRSYPEIGRKFGGRDHSTVIHAVRLVEGLRAQDDEMDNDVRSLLRQLEA